MLHRRTARFSLVLTGLLPSVPLAGQSLLQTVTGAAPSDALGAAVAAAGDVDADGHPDWIVGASQPDSTYAQPGYALVLAGKTGAVIHRLRGLSPLEQSGAAVASAGDVDNDKVPDLLVGAPYRPGTLASGAVDVFSGKDGRLIRTVWPPSQIYRFGLALRGPFDDLDNDGAPEFVVMSDRFVLVMSAKTGLALRQIQYGYLSGDRRSAIDISDDVDADGTRDIVATNPDVNNAAGEARVFSGRDGRLIHVLNGSPSTTLFGFSAAALGDVDSDRISDIAIGAVNDVDASTGFRRGAVYVFSGRTGARLHYLPGLDGMSQLGQAVAAAGDVNGDGSADLLAASLGTTRNGVHLLSTRDGRLLASRPGTVTWPTALASAGDVDRDGYLDFACGSEQESARTFRGGVARLYSGRLSALVEVRPEDCSDHPFPPLLRSGPPRLGAQVVIAGIQSPAVGAVLGSAMPARPIDLGRGCILHLDLATMFFVGPIPSVGAWELRYPLPNERGLLGQELVLQALHAVRSAPFGFELSNGLRWQLGY